MPYPLCFPGLGVESSSPDRSEVGTTPSEQDPSEMRLAFTTTAALKRPGASAA